MTGIQKILLEIQKQRQRQNSIFMYSNICIGNEYDRPSSGTNQEVGYCAP